ncbi:quaternary amine ABC transporter ATP-binding protein [Candidatus Puniceispirillum sp.]|uniref:quaternary amine ABC transporter ATP-binding protein n=2 Tax=Candidatus Puniceispirillum TaxID=767891 RepID=UPI001EB67799|nr:glycine betaine/L-proline ABC transporter ATP-binding protein [Candidatus Puniceispirillum sp.]
MSSNIEIKNVYKIFGTKPESVMPLVESGATKEDVLEQTGHTVGLDNVSLSIKAGKTFVVMGLSGSGKSTLIRHINRLIDPTAGQIIVDGKDIMTLDKIQLQEFRRKKMSMVFQRFGLMPHKTVLDNVGFGLLAQGIEEDARHESSMKRIELVGLQGFEHQYPEQLSGGMQQRVGLARALTTDPDILLMDEAFSALDPLIRSEMQRQLIELQKQMRKTIVFITHDLDEALRLGDEIAILNGGRLVQVGKPEDIVLKPADDYVAAFVADVNKSRVLRAKTIMTSLAGFTLGKRKTEPVHLETFLEDFIPSVLEKRHVISVVDDKGNVKGYISDKELSSALAKG